MLAAGTCAFWRPTPLYLCLLTLPLLVDGIVQRCCAYESTNGRRLVSGILFGYAACCLFFLFAQWGFRTGRRIGFSLIAKSLAS